MILLPKRATKEVHLCSDPSLHSVGWLLRRTHIVHLLASPLSNNKVSVEGGAATDDEIGIWYEPEEHKAASCGTAELYHRLC